MTQISDRVLVVDDDEFARDLISVQLRQLGRDKIHLAASAQDALAQFALYEKSIGVIITDLSMPGMDGTVLLRHLAQLGVQSGIILLSGVGEEILNSAAGLARAHGLNVLGALPKPTSLESMRELLRRTATAPANRGTTSTAQGLTPAILSAALRAGEFAPWYQPKVDIRSGRAAGVEALARWSHAPSPTPGPAQFVPAMEAAGLADELFFSIASQALADTARWRAQGIWTRTSVNMSMDTAHNLEVPERLLAMAGAAGLQAGDLVIEVTESRLMVERTLAMETLTRLSMMGFLLSIDDFGTGYSSLVQLVDLPFRELKIDASFVQRAATEHKAGAILRIAITIGANLGMEVVAEGVETLQQLDFLRHCGGSVVQGYHFARPMPFTECTAWLSSH